MARPMGHIRIMISSRVLFDLDEADRIFKEKGEAEYTDYMRARGKYAHAYNEKVDGRLLKPGPLYRFAIAALALNKGHKKPIIELGLMCKDNVQSALPIFRNLDQGELADMEYRMALSGGELRPEHHHAFQTDLLLTRNADDAQLAVDMGMAAAQIYTPPEGFDYMHKDGPIRIFVDGDAVAFGSSAEVTYRMQGLEIYRETEDKDFKKPIEPGPFTKILAKISRLNEEFAPGTQPFEITLLTARGSNAGARALSIIEQHGITLNGGAYFMGGASKHETLAAHKPDLFFDDQMVHLVHSAQYCPTGLVPYAAGGAMHDYQMQQKAMAENRADALGVAEAKSEEVPSQENVAQENEAQAAIKTDVLKP